MASKISPAKSAVCGNPVLLGISTGENSPKRVSSIAISPWSQRLILSSSISIHGFTSSRWFDHN
jgi:hypothetical protein